MLNSKIGAEFGYDFIWLLAVTIVLMAGMTALFCGGIFAGAFSSFLVNAMLGGTVMADALGKSADINGPWTRGLTIVLLLFGMVLAIGVRVAELDIGRLIMLAQAVTVLGNPFLAGTMLYLTYTP